MSNDEGQEKVFKKVTVTVEFNAIVPPPKGESFPLRGINQRVALAKVAELCHYLDEAAIPMFEYDPIAIDVVDIVVGN